MESEQLKKGQSHNVVDVDVVVLFFLFVCNNFAENQLKSLLPMNIKMLTSMFTSLFNFHELVVHNPFIQNANFQNI